MRYFKYTHEDTTFKMYEVDESGFVKGSHGVADDCNHRFRLIYPKMPAHELNWDYTAYSVKKNFYNATELSEEEAFIYLI